MTSISSPTFNSSSMLLRSRVTTPSSAGRQVSVQIARRIGTRARRAAPHLAAAPHQLVYAAPQPRYDAVERRHEGLREDRDPHYAPVTPGYFRPRARVNAAPTSPAVPVQSIGWDYRFEMMACVNSFVPAVPPRSLVRVSGFLSAASMPDCMLSAASAWPRCISISLAESSVARGFARFWPAYFGADPWTGSKTAISSPMFAPGATPRPPVSPAQRSERMSP